MKLKTDYEDAGEVDWATFYADPDTHQKKVVLVTNDDFKTGTLRIKHPCMIKLTESISFNPNRPETWLDVSDGVTGSFNDAVALDPNRELDWFPKSSHTNNSQYFEPEVRFAYNLGFFAALALETENVIIDLNGFTLEQHEEHALQQRFYANIELADQPFIPFQGPSNFGHVLRVTRNCWIFGGKIGRSSHHGIHGNHVDGLLIENVEFEDFEVAALALNGAKNVHLENIVVVGNRKDIPVVGTYSAGRFIKSFVKHVQDMSLSNSTLDASFVQLKEDLDNAFNAIIFDNGTLPAFFENTTQLIDGNAYGILINPKGVAVNGFLERRNSNKANEATNILINNCSINSIHGHIREIVALGATENGDSVQVDTAGSVLQFFNGVSNKVGEKYFYQGTSLSDVKIELAKIKTTLDDANQDTSFFGTLNITKGVQLWKDDPAKYFQFFDGKLKLMRNSAPYLIDSQEVIYNVKCNGDSMFHVNKGVIGFKIDGANGMCLNNVTVSDILNSGEVGSLLCGNYQLSHPAQGSLLGYQGDKTYGMTVSGVNDLISYHLNVADVESVNSSSTGIILQNESYNLHLESTKVKNVKAAVNVPFDNSQVILPNVPIQSRGFHVTHDLYSVFVKEISVEGIQQNEDNPFNSPYDIESNIILN